MTDIIQIPGWKATGQYQEGTLLVLQGTYTTQDEACHKCGSIGNLYKHGTKVLRYRDIPFRMAPTVIEGTVQRYRCRDCGETFVQTPNGMDDIRRMTDRCIEFIKQQCIPHTFTHIAELVGCVEGTVRAIAAERFDEFDDSYKPYLPEWMGMDETQLAGEMRGVITDVGNKRPVDILRDREKPTIIKWLSQFEDKTTVKGLTIDMWKPYRDAAQIVFPGLPVVIDKFHVVRMANFALEDVRIASQKEKDKKVRVAWKRSRLLLLARYKKLNDKARFNLDMWLDNEDDIREAYWLKERLYDIYDMPKAEAIAAYDAYADSIPPGMKKHFSDLTRLMRNWRTEIINYLDFPITNGYTEAYNGVLKVINRNGRGYGFDVLRAKALGRKPRTKIVKPAPIPEGFQRIYPNTWTTEGHQMLVEALGSICTSCGGKFSDLHAHDIPAILPGQKPKRDYICATCYARFHTKEVGHGNQDSTPKCE